MLTVGKTPKDHTTPHKQHLGFSGLHVLIKKHGEDEWGMLQELNLARGVKPGQHWSTWTFAPYYWKMRNLGYLEESNEKD